MPTTRRDFVRQTAAWTAASTLLPHLRAATGSGSARHPRLFLTATAIDGLQSVDSFRIATQQDTFLGQAWTALVQRARTEATLPPLQPDSTVPHRPASMIRDRNLDYYLCFETGARLNRLALTHLITGDEACLHAALDQLDALFDPEQWPDWIDQAHLRFGHPADLRTGMLLQDTAIAYDWLHPSLSDSQRADLREGIDRRGIQPFLTSVAQQAWWTEDLNNWITVIAGGAGVAAMALQGEHPDADRIIGYTTAKFEAYLETYGPQGEFNESVAYANANRLPVGYYHALRYATGGRDDRLGQSPFPEMCRWVMHTTLDDKRIVPFGDAWPERAVVSGYVAAVAAAAQDPVLQHYFLHTRSPDNAHPINLLTYDPRLQPLSPTGREPLAIAFQGHGGVIVSRTSWEQNPTDCIVFSKCGREENHEHNDIGQVGFDTLGERLIVDLGSPSSYPEDFFEPDTRWKYYNASVRSHNVLMFGGREQRYPVRERGDPIEVSHLSGQLIHWRHQPGQGTVWRMDLTPAYDGVTRITRTVIHLWPGYLAVLDDALLPHEEEISLRWHTIDRAAPEDDGSFVVRQGNAAATARILNLTDSPLTLQRREHHYEAPYDRERSGDPLEARHESYVEATLTTSHCRLLTLFATGEAGAFGGDARWRETDGQWTYDSVHGPVSVAVRDHFLQLSAPHLDRNLFAP